MKKQIIFLLIQYVLLSLLFILVLSGCSAIPDFTARAEINNCSEVSSVSIDETVYPYLEITINDGNVRLSSSDLCFGLYVFNGFGDTLYHHNFQVIGKNNIELLNILN